ncbi:hypothetical protein HAZT_HAZT006297, partial [Hyalella azteca]
MPPMSSAGGLQGPPMTSSCLSTNTKQTATPVKSGGIATPQHTPLRTDTLPPAKRLKIGEEASGPSFGGSSGGTTSYRDVCVGTSVGTITEPDCLGPCEPGTSVTLEGIVWHETQGGVLVVNVTWRGKTYVGTLLDCTQHDWAPPRFCDSPNTEDMDSRTPKGRGKRGRYGGGNVQTSQSSGTSGAGSSAISGSSGGNGGNNQTSSNSTSNTSTNDVGNVTETRSGKVRGNQPQKGRRGGGNNSGNSFATPNSPQNTAANKRKGRDTDVLNSNDLKNKKGRMSGKITDGSADNSPDNSNSASQAADDAAPLTVSSPAQSPQYIECPEPNCSKKYKHMNGLKYHQNHAHNSTEEDGCGQVDGDDSGNLVSEEVGDEKKEAQDSTNFQAGPPSFPGGLYPYAGGLAPPPHYTSDPYYAHLAHSLPPVAQAAPVDVSHPSSKEVSGLPVPNLSAPKLGSGSPYQASLDPRLLHPLLSTGLPLPVRLPHPVDNSHSKDGEAGPLSLENKITAPSSDNDNREGPNSLDATASSSGSSFSQ